MRKFRFMLQSLALLVSVIAFVSFAQAQSTRTFISGVGNDADPCSRTAPCRTFSGALIKTATNGEINALDAGGFGAITIGKSITLDGTGPHSSLLASAVTGVFINITTTAATDPLATVRLKNLSINGTGTLGGAGTRTGTRGINVSSANTRQVKLFVENVFIHGFINEGILFNGNGGDLSVKNCSIIDNGSSGIRVLSAGANIVHVTIDRVTANLNQQGIRFEGNAFGSVYDSTASNNTLNGFVVNPVSQGNAEMTIINSRANNNRQFGIFAGGTGFTGTARIADVNAINNTTLQLEVAAGGQICTNQKNHIGTPSDAPSCTFLDQ